ncbi:MAG: PD40 domain-containing protein, partial [Chloroflexi bacterium]|nr:PD40 domain-containing protein [Chloroflexota bacterium]
MTRSFRPDDLYRLNIATDPRLSPDGSRAVFTVQTVAPAKDGYRSSLWTVATDGDGPARQLTIGARHDRRPRFAPDGRSIAFLSDRRLHVEEEPAAGEAKDREDGDQVHILPLDGGEARRITDLPRGVDEYWWSPDGSRLLVKSASRESTKDADSKRRGITAKPKPGDAPESDYHFVDRLGYQYNGTGFIYHLTGQLWVLDIETGEARRLTDDPAGVGDAAWSPDGTEVVYTTNLRPDHDLELRAHLVVVDVEGGRSRRLTGDAATFGAPAWLPDGKTIAAIGGYLPANFYVADLWLIAADGSDAGPEAGGRNLTSRHDLMLATSMNSDIVPGEAVRIVPSADGRWITFQAPKAGSGELWR